MLAVLHNVHHITEFIEITSHGYTHMASLFKRVLKDGTVRTTLGLTARGASYAVIAMRLVDFAYHTCRIKKSVEKGANTRIAVDLSGICYGALLLGGLFQPGETITRLRQAAYVSHLCTMVAHNASKPDEKHRLITWGCALDCFGHGLESWFLGEGRITDSIGLAGHFLLIGSFFCKAKPKKS